MLALLSSCKFSAKNITHKNDVFVFHANVPFRRRILETLRCIYIQFDAFPYPFENGILSLSDPIRAQSTIALLEQAIKEENQTKAVHYINDLMFLDSSLSAPAQSRIGKTVSECIAFFQQITTARSRLMSSRGVFTSPSNGWCANSRVKRVQRQSNI